MAGVLFFHFGRRSFRTAFGSERRAVDLLPPDPTVACPSRCTVATPHRHARSHLTRGQIGLRLGRPARHCTGCAGAYAGRAAPTRAPPKERWSMDRRYVRADEWGAPDHPRGQLRGSASLKSARSPHGEQRLLRDWNHDRPLHEDLRTSRLLRSDEEDAAGPAIPLSGISSASLLAILRILSVRGASALSDPGSSWPTIRRSPFQARGLHGDNPRHAPEAHPI